LPQPIVTASVWQSINYASTPYLNGWTHPTSTTFVCHATGIYLFIISASYSATGGSRQIMLRATINGVEIVGSQVFVDIQSSSIIALISRNFMAAINAGDSVVIEFDGNSTVVQLIAGAFSPPISVTPTSTELIISRIV